MENNNLLARLINHRNFLIGEIRDFPVYSETSYSKYLQDRRFRREIERWIENILISVVDICKIVLTLENVDIPDTYRKIVSDTFLFFGEISKEVSNFISLRNVIVHEYLDIRWERIERFLKSKDKIDKFIEEVEKYLNKRRK